MEYYRWYLLFYRLDTDSHTERVHYEFNQILSNPSGYKAENKAGYAKLNKSDKACEWQLEN